MKCQRCGNTLPEPVDGWSTCTKCGLARFLGEPVVETDVSKKENGNGKETKSDIQPDDESELHRAAKAAGKTK